MNGEEKKIIALRAANMESKNITRESIRMALLKLMKDNDFEKITVTSIINLSGVSRAGFYRNYSSKEDVMDDISASIKATLQETLNNREYAQNPYLFYHDLFSGIKENPVEFGVLFDANVPRKYAMNALPTIPQSKNELTAEERYRFIALLTSLRSIVYDWFRSGMKESAEEMAQLMVNLFHKDL